MFPEFHLLLNTHSRQIVKDTVHKYFGEIRFLAIVFHLANNRIPSFHLNFREKSKMPRKTLKLRTIRPSRKPEKKYDAVFVTEKGREKVVSFGAAGMSDFTKHKDKTRRARYLKRHAGMGENWNKPDTPGALSRWILWGPSSSFRESVKTFRRRFRV
jgi:hypothetical protein